MVVKIMGFYTGACQWNQLFARGTQSSTSTSGHYSTGFLDNPFDNDCTLHDTTKNVFNINAGNDFATPESFWRDTPQLVENQWYKIVSVFDSVNYKLYVNGVLRKTYVTPGTPIGESTDSVIMGMDVWEAGAGYPYNFKGVIDDAKLFGRALSDSEVIHYGDTCGKINLQPAPVTLAVGGNASFTVGSSMSPAGYQWQQNSGSGFVNLSNTAPYSGVNTGALTITGITAAMSAYQYRCIVGNSWGCIDTSQGAQLTATTGVNNVVYNSPLVTVYPNPAKNKITIELPGNEGASVQIINVVGQLMKEMSFTGSKLNMNVGDLQVGVYFVRVKYNDYIITKKLLKE